MKGNVIKGYCKIYDTMLANLLFIIGNLEPAKTNLEFGLSHTGAPPSPVS